MERRDEPALVVIGASAGGVEALSDLLSYVPPNLRAIVVCATHRGPHQPNRLQEILARAAHLPVVVPHDGEKLQPGVCYVGMADPHLTIGPGPSARLIADGFYRGHNIDALFAAAARHGGERVIGVVLSGLGKDGTEGLTAIKDLGGVALVQSIRDAAYGDMPRSAIALDGKIDFVGTTKELAEEICRRVQVPVSAVWRREMKEQSQ
jgi:two-component system chemotaxis response regulator CheB